MHSLRSLAAFLSVVALLAAGCPKKEEEEPPAPPTLSNAGPASGIQGEGIRFVVDAVSDGSTVTSVTLDLSAFAGGAAAQAMYDDATHGDLTAGDDTWSFFFYLPNDATVGAESLLVTAEDAEGSTVTAILAFTVVQNQPPAVANPYLSRDPLPPGGRFLVTVDASDPDGTLDAVTADLSAVNGPAVAALYDDGTHGDAAAGDGTWSLESVADPASTPGSGRTIVFTARDNAQATTEDQVAFTVSTNVVPLLSNPQASPSHQLQNLDMLFTVTATDDGTLSYVRIDLSALNGAAAQDLYDDGTNGDAAAGDDVWSFRFTLPSDCPGGSYLLTLTAEDDQAETNYITLSVSTEENDPPVLQNPSASPDPTARKKNVVLTVDASDTDGTVSSVTLDLSSLSGTSAEAMNDSGTGADVTAGDGTWTLSWFVAQDATVGLHNLAVTAVDDDGVPSSATLPLTVDSNVTPTASNPQCTPSSEEVGLWVTLEVDATDDTAVTLVSVDLSSVGGSSTQTMFDDGTNGDATPTDGTYAYFYQLPGTTSTGSKSLTVTVQDGSGETDTAVIGLTVNANSAPTVQNASVSPGFCQPGTQVTLTVDASDAQGLASVTVDLSAYGGSTTQALFDDGTNGDASSSDGTFTCQFTPGAHAAPGSTTLTFTATDVLTATATDTASLTVARFRLEHAGFLEDIHGTSGTDIYTVGDFSQIYRYDGSDWRLVDAAPGEDRYWYSVWCESATSVWVGGDSGRVQHWNGTSWSANDPGVNSAYAIKGLWADGAGKVYAVGGEPGSGPGDNNGVRAVYDASTGWSGGTTVAGDDFNDVFGAAAGDVVCVGDDGLVHHYYGGSWHDESFSTSDDLFGVWGYSDGTNEHYWAVSGRLSKPYTPNIYYYTSASRNWTAVSGTLPFGSVNLYGVHGSVSSGSLNALYVVGLNNNSYFYGTVWKSTDGQNFTQVKNSSPPGGAAADYFPWAPYPLILEDAWLPAGGTDLWIAGHRTIQKHVPTGTPEWHEYSRGTYEDTRAVDVFSSSVAVTYDYPRRPTGTNAVQISSIVHHLSSGSWSEYTDRSGNQGPELDTYSMLSPPSGSQTAIHPRIYAVKMFSTSALYAVGDDGHVVFWDGQTSTTHDFSSVQQYGTGPTDQRRLYALWGTSATDFWFGGEDERIYHYTGGSWSSSPPVSSQLSGSGRDITGLWGSSSSNVYAILADTFLGTRTANQGDVYRYDGSSWSSVLGTQNLPSSIDNLNGVWGSSSSDVYLVGDNGAIYYYNGTAWSDIASNLGSPSADLTAVFGDAGDVFVIGEGTRIWYKRSGTWHALRANGSSARWLGGGASGSLVLLAGSKGITLRLQK